MLKPHDFFDLNDEVAIQLFDKCEYVWDALKYLPNRIGHLVGKSHTIEARVPPGVYLGENPIYISKTAVVEPGSFIEGPAYIGAGVVVRHGAYIRGDVILLENSLLGHASEAKNCILMPAAHAPHFNYVGDSILGSGVNLGAGTKLSNLTLVSSKDTLTMQYAPIKVTVRGKVYDTGLGKLGAILGDNSQTGCNVVLNPGCLVGRSTLIYAGISLRKGYYPSNKILKLRQKIVTAARQ